MIISKYLKKCLERTIETEYVSVFHDYDLMETIYTIPYNATLAPTPVKMALVRATMDDEDFDESDNEEVNDIATAFATNPMPLFSITIGYHINSSGVLMADYTLDFEGEVLFMKSYEFNKQDNKNPVLSLVRKCSNKIVAQERAAQKHKMQKMFVSMNMFKLNEQPGKM